MRESSWRRKAKSLAREFLSATGFHVDFWSTVRSGWRQAVNSLDAWQSSYWMRRRIDRRTCFSWNLFKKKFQLLTRRKMFVELELRFVDQKLSSEAEFVLIDCWTIDSSCRTTVGVELRSNSFIWFSSIQFNENITISSRTTTNFFCRRIVRSWRRLWLLVGKTFKRNPLLGETVETRETKGKTWSVLG